MTQTGYKTAEGARFAQGVARIREHKRSLRNAFIENNDPTPENVAKLAFADAFSDYLFNQLDRLAGFIDSDPSMGKLPTVQALAVESGALSVEESEAVLDFFEKQITNTMLATVLHEGSADAQLKKLITTSVLYGTWIEAERQKYIAGTQPVTSPFATGDGSGDENGPAHVHDEETENDATEALLAAFVGKEEAARIREVATGKKSNYDGAGRASVQSFAGPGDGTGNATDVSEPGTGDEELPTTDTVNDPTPNDSDPCTGASVTEQSSKASEAVTEPKTYDPCIGF